MSFFFSDEANAFLKANEQRGKALETTYEQIREQDLNDLEALVKRRNQMRFSRSLKRLIWTYGLHFVQGISSYIHNSLEDFKLLNRWCGIFVLERFCDLFQEGSIQKFLRDRSSYRRSEYVLEYVLYLFLYESTVTDSVFSEATLSYTFLKENINRLHYRIYGYMFVI